MNLTIHDGEAVAPCVFIKQALKDAIGEAGYFADGHINTEYGCSYRGEKRPCLWCRVKRIVLFDDPDSVSLVDAKVWKNNTSGTAFMKQGHDAERQAREDAATHKRCNDCSELYEKRSYCRTCSNDKDRRDFNRLTPVEYKEQPCVIGDTWFFNDVGDYLLDYLIEHEIPVSEVRVEEISPQELPQIDLEHWHDDLPEDYDENTLHPEIMKALDALNAAIDKHGKEVSYFRNGNRIVLPDDFMEQS